MQITIDLPDNLPLTEAEVRIELAIVLERLIFLTVKFEHLISRFPLTDRFWLDRTSLGCDRISVEVDPTQVSQGC